MISDDDLVMYLARAHDTEVIVSGDADLLDWPEPNPPVVAPEKFERMLAPD